MVESKEGRRTYSILSKNNNEVLFIKLRPEINDNTENLEEEEKGKQAEMSATTASRHNSIRVSRRQHVAHRKYSVDSVRVVFRCARAVAHDIINLMK